jgi:hypothetical protein
MRDINWEEFKNPPKSARPMVRWWWTGLDVDKDELVKEVQEMDDAGFLGAEIQVFKIGLPWKFEKKYQEKAKRTHRFMQPYYYEMLRAILDEAAKREMIIDLTIGSSWPAGGTHIKKAESLKVLLMGEKKIRGPKIFKGQVPKLKKPLYYKLLKLSKILVGYNLAEFFEEDMKIEAVIAVKPIGKFVKIKRFRVKTRYIEYQSILDLTDKVDENGLLNWEVPAGKWQVFAFYKGPSGARVLLDSRSSPDKYSLVLDHLSSSAIKNHLELHLGEGKKYFGEHFGKTLRAFFTDSLELGSEWHWTDDFLEQFEKRRGYNLRPFLPICSVPGRDNTFFITVITNRNMVPIADFPGDIGERIRYDLELTISDLFIEEFVGAMTEWAHKNNLKNRIQSYGIQTDLLRSFGSADIPEIEQLYAGGIINFLKLAGSAGVLYDKSIITAESIVWRLRDYMTTPLKWKVAADRLFVAGINQMIYHGFPYQNPSFPYPGYCAFSDRFHPRLMNFSSNFSRINPFWEFFPIINGYITRCQYILQHSKTICNIAVFYPLYNYSDSLLKIEELTGGYLDENDGPISNSNRVKKLKKWNRDEIWTFNLIELGDNLNSYGFNYVHINSDSILDGTIVNNKFFVGQGEFDVLIFPYIDKITLPLAEKLSHLANTGIPIIFIDEIPNRQPGFLDYKKNDIKINNVISKLIESKKIYHLKHIKEIVPFLKDTLGLLPGIESIKPGHDIFYIHKSTSTSDYYFLRHSTNQPVKISLRFPHKERVPFFLDPWTGEINQAVHYSRLGDYIILPLEFEAYGSIIIEFKISEEDFHVIESPININRHNSSIIVHTESSGNYTLELSDKKKITVNFKKETLEPIYIRGWDFTTEIRDHNGHFEHYETHFEQLEDWRSITDLKYCSSKGIYTASFTLKSEYIQENILVTLSIERVHDVAIVKINNMESPPLMVYPYQLDITPYVKIGENLIEIEVTPTIRNRLIGYGKNGGKNWKNHKRKKSFMPSGIISPVKVEFKQIFRIT